MLASQMVNKVSHFEYCCEALKKQNSFIILHHLEKQMLICVEKEMHLVTHTHTIYGGVHTHTIYGHTHTQPMGTHTQSMGAHTHTHTQTHPYPLNKEQ